MRPAPMRRIASLTHQIGSTVENAAMASVSP